MPSLSPFISIAGLLLNVTQFAAIEVDDMGRDLDEDDNDHRFAIRVILVGVPDIMSRLSFYISHSDAANYRLESSEKILDSITEQMDRYYRSLTP